MPRRNDGQQQGVTSAALAAAARGDIDNFMVATVPGGIEAQEAQGQRDFVASATLPIEMLHGCTRRKLEEMGIKFGDHVDALFVNVTLPNGWEVRPTDHSMWSELFDADGSVRARIFYKAAFYDRSAHIFLAEPAA